jgi:hypothetical protein
MSPRQSFLLRPFLVIVLAEALLVSPPSRVEAGCGCEKPPPPLADIRPNAAYVGAYVQLFAPEFQIGQTYNVTFTSGTTGQSITVQSAPVLRRDVADARYKPQLIVQVPLLSLGPTSLSVRHAGQSDDVFFADDASFTVVPQPLVIPSQTGEYRIQGVQAAVSRGRVMYLSLDLSRVTLPMIFQVQAKGYPLRFGGDDVTFYNGQGFLMQLLDQGMPGLFAVATATSSGDSNLLRYSRHEFNSFYLHHRERQYHQLDAADPNWHTDGTPHIDHDHLIAALRGALNGAPPVPGATPPFELVLQTFSLFHEGLFGRDYVDLTNFARTDSYHSKTGASGGARGDVLSNGLVKMNNEATINGNVRGFAFDVTDKAKIEGSTTKTTKPLEFMPIILPPGLTDLGNVELSNGATRTLVGPVSYKATKVVLSNNGRLRIDNTAGPVTLYIMGEFSATNDGKIITTDPNPEKFAVYMVGKGDVKLSNNSSFYGVVYAPESVVDLSGQGEFFGAFVGKEMKVSGYVKVHYDAALQGE